MNSTHSRRLRNPHVHEEKQKEPFFSHASQREQRPFFGNQQSKGQAVQTKLTIGKPGDRYEQQADQVANQVVDNHSQVPGLQQQELESIQRITLMTPAEDEKLGTAEARMEKDKLIQEKVQMRGEQEERKKEVQAKEEEEEVQAQQEEEEEELQPKQEEERVQAQQEGEEEEAIQAQQEGEEESVQAKTEAAGNVASPGVTKKLKQSADGGQPLTGDILVEMEQAFGANFSNVIIHTDADAVLLNKKLHSQAFTRGHDIYFNQGKYRPETSAGKKLLAHELTHVIQQCGRKLGAKHKPSK